MIKMRTTFIALTTILATMVLVFQSCKKEETAPNQSPGCKITAPADGQVIKEGEAVTITVDATDSDGSITKVVFYIDSIEKGSSTSVPYHYDWNTTGETMGQHTIMATATDNNGEETSYKITVSIIAGAIFTDPRDGQTYAIIKIGTQTWFAQNLNYETEDSWWYDNSSTYGNTYGRLYTWDAAQTACPDGWHLPGDDEWKQLEMALGMSQSEADKISGRGTDEGKKMKSTDGWQNNGNGTNASGFNVLPGGLYSDELFAFRGIQGVFWTSTDCCSSLAYCRLLYSYFDQIYREEYYKSNSFSVRCVKN